MKILIADDNEELRTGLKEILESEGYSVVTASNGSEAIALASGDPPDMIISDILMPGMDGFMLCRAVKKDKQLRRIPFIFYTAAYDDPRDEDLAMALGASRFILKPKLTTEFLDILKEVIAEHEKADLHVPRMPLEEDLELYEKYNERLSKMLDRKMSDLEMLRKALNEEQRRLKSSEIRYRKLIDTANDAIFIADATTGTIIDCNMSASALIGIPADEIRGMHQSKLHPPEEAEKYKKIFERHARSGKAISEELEVVNSRGDRIPVEISASVTEIDGRKIIQGIFRDLSQRRAMEEELRNRIRELEEFCEMAIGREVKMKELKEENAALKEKIKRLEGLRGRH
jgi:PAS domain S-box-containing protein